MTDAPERIATWCWNGKTNAGQWSNNLNDHYAPTVEYVRADLVEALGAENQRLREAVTASGKLGQIIGFLEGDDARTSAFLECCGPDLINRARAVLRSTEARHDD